MDYHFDIGRVFEIGKFDITRLTCNFVYILYNYSSYLSHCLNGYNTECYGNLSRWLGHWMSIDCEIFLSVYGMQG